MLPLILAAVDTPENKTILEAIYCRYVQEMYNMAMKRLGNHHDAEEAVAEGFLRIARKFSDFKIDSVESDRTKGLVTIIVLNEVKRTCKARGLRWARETSFDGGTETVFENAQNHSSPDGIQQEEPDVMSQILAAIQELPELYRDILFLYLVKEQKPRDIAYLLNISGATVRKRIERGKKILAEKLIDLKEGDPGE